jgi:5-methyltetrahydropteroyltriglutamate--homocysteine methyltransferase
MMRSTDCFLTTHAGSLPRPDDLVRIMYAKEEGQAVERAELASHVRNAVAGVVARQKGAGVDIINDGEMSKPSYATYVKDRLSGFGGTGNTFVYQDLADFPNLAKRVFGDPGRSSGRPRLATGRSHSAILRRFGSTSRILQPPSARVSGRRRSYPRRPLA